MGSLLKLTNNALGRLNATVSTVDTTVTLVPGQGAKFPAIVNTGEHYPGTLVRASDGAIEIVNVTGRSGDVLTVARAQENTTALAFAINDRFELRLTGGALQGELDRMAGLLDGKADASTVASKADGAATTAALAGKASTASVASKANSADVLALVGGGIVTGSVGVKAGSANGTQRLMVPMYQADGTLRFLIGFDSDDTPVMWSYGSTGANTGSVHYGNGNVTASGTVSGAVVTQTSDERHKENWQILTDAQLDALADMQLAGLFQWKHSGEWSIGGSAQEIRAIVPQAVYEDVDGYLTVNYGGLGFAIQQATLRRLWGKR
jgi:hypothetical protein